MPRTKLSNNPQTVYNRRWRAKNRKRHLAAQAVCNRRYRAKLKAKRGKSK